jgi:hypothetical protein
MDESWVVKKEARTRHTQRPIGGFTWDGLFILGLVLLVLHKSDWASAWVTAVAILFALFTVSSAVWGVLDRHLHRR